jgi:hypothetical protein
MSKAVLQPQALGSIDIDFVVSEHPCIACSRTLTPGTRIFCKSLHGSKAAFSFCGDCIAPHLDAKREAAIEMAKEVEARRAGKVEGLTMLPPAVIMSNIRSFLERYKDAGILNSVPPIRVEYDRYSSRMDVTIGGDQ